MTYMTELLIRLAADGAMILAGLIAAYAFIFVVPRKDWWYWAWRIVLAGITTYAAAKLLAHYYQPNELRPYELLGLTPGASYLPNPGFPSDHALFAMFLTLAVWFSTRRRMLALIMLGLALVISLGRVLALVHAPIDVVAGLLIPLIGIVWYRHTRQKVVE